MQEHHQPTDFHDDAIAAWADEDDDAVIVRRSGGMSYEIDHITDGDRDLVRKVNSHKDNALATARKYIGEEIED